MRLQILALIVSISPYAMADRLSSYKVDPKGITVSGISSGAMMAVQMHVVHSSLISGSAAMAGAVYGCAEGQLGKAVSTCMHLPDQVEPAKFVSIAENLARRNEIDQIENLKGKTVYVYTGTGDRTVHPGQSDRLQEFFGLLGAEVIGARRDGAAHGVPTLNYGANCSSGGSPWLLNCGYDGAGEILRTLLRIKGERGQADLSHLHEFSQEEFFPSSDKPILYPKGWIYVPSACATGEQCALHVALHGCQMDPSFIQDQFVKNAGYNEWAESRHVIILYPQAIRDTKSNPNGCWDWWGYTGPEYATKSGKQISAIKAMIDRVRGASGQVRP